LSVSSSLEARRGGRGRDGFSSSSSEVCWDNGGIRARCSGIISDSDSLDSSASFGRGMSLGGVGRDLTGGEATWGGTCGKDRGNGTGSTAKAGSTGASCLITGRVARGGTGGGGTARVGASVISRSLSSDSKRSRCSSSKYLPSVSWEVDLSLL
jgi:hypothetical protein